jgi:hypothetical protein
MIRAVLALSIILLAAACDTMQPTEGATPPADLLEEDTGNGGMGGGY